MHPLDTIEKDLYFQIVPVDLVVAPGPDVAGKAERFDHAGHLMRRLDQIGRRGLYIVSLSEGGQPHAPAQIAALNHYLRALRGLRSFRRICRTSWRTKWGWAEFRDRLDFPTLAVLVNL